MKNLTSSVAALLFASLISFSCRDDRPVVRVNGDAGDSGLSGSGGSSGGSGGSSGSGGSPGSGGTAGTDAGTDRPADVGDVGVDQVVKPDLPANATLAEKCTGTGGTARRTLCCAADIDYPEFCAGVGACACAPMSSREVTTCGCPAGTCFSRERGCIGPDCTPGQDQTCNDNSVISTTTGMCLNLPPQPHCVCNPGYTLNPATGRCR
jgi:hypothetical protein